MVMLVTVIYLVRSLTSLHCDMTLGWDSTIVEVMRAILVEVFSFHTLASISLQK